VLVGVVDSVDDGTGDVVVQVKYGTLVTVETDAETAVTIDGKPATVADLEEDMMVVVGPPTGVADRIDAKSPPPPPPPPPPQPPLIGVVFSVDAADDLIVVALKDATQVTVQADADTVVMIDGKAGTLAGLAKGMMVAVTPPTGTADTIDAKSPTATTPPPTPAPKPPPSTTMPPTPKPPPPPTTVKPPSTDLPGIKLTTPKAVIKK
jgi:hypothetical protein